LLDRSGAEAQLAALRIEVDHPLAVDPGLDAVVLDTQSEAIPAVGFESAQGGGFVFGGIAANTVRLDCMLPS
jgi:hypothetical protein